MFNVHSMTSFKICFSIGFDQQRSTCPTHPAGRSSKSFTVNPSRRVDADSRISPINLPCTPSWRTLRTKQQMDTRRSQCTSYPTDPATRCPSDTFFHQEASDKIDINGTGVMDPKGGMICEITVMGVVQAPMAGPVAAR
jgi:hypothetical protein